MAIAINVEQVVAGFINRNCHEKKFDVDDVYDYIRSLWNAGCGPIRLNFTREDLICFLDKCCTVCLEKDDKEYIINKELLNDCLSLEERDFFRTDDKDIARSFDLFCKLKVDLRTPKLLMYAMGFDFMYRA